MKINREVIEKLNPCKDRFDNYIQYYGDKEFSIRQFMGLKNISHADKVWVAVRLIAKDKLRFAVADIAELVLPVFERKYPTDSRPRKAIEAARSCNIVVAACAARAAYTAACAACAAYTAAACAACAAYAAAACAAGNSAACAAYAAYAAANAAGNSAARAAYAATAADRLKTEKQIRTILIKYLK